MRAQVDYERTRRRPIPGSIEAGITNMFYLPTINLRNYTPCLYTWLYNGQEILEKPVQLEAVATPSILPELCVGRLAAP